MTHLLPSLLRNVDANGKDGSFSLVCPCLLPSREQIPIFRNTEAANTRSCCQDTCSVFRGERANESPQRPCCPGKDQEKLLDTSRNAKSQPLTIPFSCIRTCTSTRSPGDLHGCWDLRNAPCLQSKRLCSLEAHGLGVKQRALGSGKPNQILWQWAASFGRSSLDKKLSVSQVSREEIGEQDCTKSKWDHKIK